MTKNCSASVLTSFLFVPLLVTAKCQTRTAQADLVRIAIGDERLTGTNAGKDTLHIEFIYPTDTWDVFLRMRETGETESGDSNVFLGSGSFGSLSLGHHTGSQYIDDGVGKGEESKDTLTSMHQYWTSGTHYYQYRCEWI